MEKVPLEWGSGDPEPPSGSSNGGSQWLSKVVDLLRSTFFAPRWAPWVRLMGTMCLVLLFWAYTRAHGG